MGKAECEWAPGFPHCVEYCQSTSFLYHIQSTKWEAPWLGGRTNLREWQLVLLEGIKEIEHLNASRIPSRSPPMSLWECFIYGFSHLAQGKPLVLHMSHPHTTLPCGQISVLTPYNGPSGLWQTSSGDLQKVSEMYGTGKGYKVELQHYLCENKRDAVSTWPGVL